MKHNSYERVRSNPENNICLLALSCEVRERGQHGQLPMKNPASHGAGPGSEPAGAVHTG
jgi:hypothetical protein